MALLGWIVPVEDVQKPGSFVENVSGHYESRFISVTIAMMLKGTAGWRLGVWITHSEGRSIFPEPTVLTNVLEKQLAPLRYER